MERLYTIGYEGASLSDFIRTLKVAGVDVLLDVREIAISRRKGFSKQALAHALRDVGIEYRHERALGSPKTIRDALHQDKDYATFFALFETYLNTQHELLKTLAESLSGGVALMCYERDPKTCHRSVIAQHLNELTGLSPKHIGVRNYGNNCQASLHLGQGVPTAQPAI
jgi:uncharacterized protein (DUF488 family)